jgi:endonuclease YncB( thermonuclease family)
MFEDLKQNLDSAKSYFLEGVDTIGYCFKVIDGDTIKCVINHRGEYLKVTVRLDGVDTPEKGSSPASIATDFTKRMALDKNVKLVFKSLDKYGRHLCDVYACKGGAAEEQSVSDLLLDSKLANEYHGGKKKAFCS